MRNSNSNRGEVAASVVIVLLIIGVIASIPYVKRKINFDKIIDCKASASCLIDANGVPLPKPRP